MTSDFLLPLIKIALAEDIGTGDITSQLLIAEDTQMQLAFVARQGMVLCGVDVPALVYQCHPGEGRDPVLVQTLMHDGQLAKAGDIIATVSGNARSILTGERTALNIMQRMSGVATLTRQYVDAVSGTKTKILDTRKTIPGMRVADKYAVRIGGGMNHRMGLWDAVLVKDNHVAGFGIQDSGFGEMINNIRHKLSSLNPESRILTPVFVECDTLAQLAAVIDIKPDRIMLDNMSLDMLREAVKITAGRIPLEATGGVTLANVRSVAETGVDFISVGAITHSAPAVDIGLDVIET